MARIEGIDLPNEKKIKVALTYVRGIGPSLAKKILAEVELSPDARVKDLTEAQVGKIREAVQKGGYRLEGELVTEVLMNVKRLKEIGAYRGLRHEKNLPARGQRTRTNARTRRGRKMAIAGTSRSAIESKKTEKT